MKYSIILLLAMLLIVPACVYHKKTVPPASASTTSTVQTADATTPDEDLDAFVLDDNENPFAAAVEENGVDEELALVSADEVVGQDRYADSMKYGFKTIYFDFDHYDIRPDQQAALDLNVAAAKKLADKNYTIVCEGNSCDSAGSASYNLLLSEERAQHTKETFVAAGIDPQKIKTVGRGSENRIVQSGNRQQQWPNRRVELYAYPA